MCTINVLSESLFHNTVKSLVSKSVAVNVFLDSRAAQLDKQSAPSETSNRNINYSIAENAFFI